MSGNGTDAPETMAELRAHMQSAVMMVGILVRKLGGTVTVTAQEIAEIYDYTLIRDDQAEGSVTLYTRLTPPGGEGDGEEG